MAQGLSKKSKFSHTDLHTRLRNGGLKATKNRVAILNVMQQSHGPFSVQEIHEQLIKNFSIDSFDMVTLYRALSRMEDVGIVTRCDFGDNIARYEITYENHHHHHIICRSCRRIDSISDCPVIESGVSRIFKGYRNVAHKLEFFGTCPACQVT